MVILFPPSIVNVFPWAIVCGVPLSAPSVKVVSWLVLVFAIYAGTAKLPSSLKNLVVVPVLPGLGTRPALSLSNSCGLLDKSV